MIAQRFGHADGGAGLAARRPLLRARRDHLRMRLAERLPLWACPRPAGGLSVWAQLPAPISSALVVQAAERGLRLASGPRFGVDGAVDGPACARVGRVSEQATVNP